MLRDEVNGLNVHADQNEENPKLIGLYVAGNSWTQPLAEIPVDTVIAQGGNYPLAENHLAVRQMPGEPAALQRTAHRVLIAMQALLTN